MTKADSEQCSFVAERASIKFYCQLPAGHVGVHRTSDGLVFNREMTKAGDFEGMLDAAFDAARRHYAANMNFSRDTPGAITDCLNELKAAKQAVLDAYTKVVERLDELTRPGTPGAYLVWMFEFANAKCGRPDISARHPSSFIEAKFTKLESDLAAALREGAEQVVERDQRIEELKGDLAAAKVEIERLRAAIKRAGFNLL